VAGLGHSALVALFEPSGPGPVLPPSPRARLPAPGALAVTSRNGSSCTHRFMKGCSGPGTTG
jgi:hypothetical protein